MSENGKKHSISRESLLKMFSGSTVLDSISPKAASKDPIAEKENNVPIGYQQTNKIMMQQIRQLKLDVANGKRQIEDLRKENFRLSECLHALEAATENERVEMILNERLKKKLGQLAQISKRCIETMEKHKEDFTIVLSDIG
ncbi:unnamed protein product, partial [Mesorhabditis belari]|uniref:Uncharacterized protein n=1 Tax=Mesorhabditis belari TaxID=2138241 RepID=A0AAF3ECR1_9BILA